MLSSPCSRRFFDCFVLSQVLRVGRLRPGAPRPARLLLLNTCLLLAAPLRANAAGPQQWKCQRVFELQVAKTAARAAPLCFVIE